MSKSVIFLLILMAGLAGALLLPFEEPWTAGTANNTNSNLNIAEAEDSEVGEQNTLSDTTDGGPDWANKIADLLRQQLVKKQYARAVSTINNNYATAQVSDLDRFKSIVVTHAATLMGSADMRSATALLEEYTAQFDDLDAWRMLAMAYVRLEQWPDAFRVLKTTTALENESTRYLDSLTTLDTVAGKIAADLEMRDDTQGVLALYRELFELFPQHARFQLKLGRALANIGDLGRARQQFESLLYEPDIGFLAQREIDAIDAQLNSQSNELKPVANTPTAGTNQIVVPLIRAGTSLIVDSKIEGASARLLLDTGASITALSSSLIARLNLAPTGRSIRLTTANGVTEARLFSAYELKFGRVTFSNIVVAEIELPVGSQIVGLLGTDILRRMNDRYSYVIDDERDALIFKPK